MKKEKSCRNCLLGVRIHVNGDVLCRLKGAVSADYCCKRHRSAPVRIVPREEGSPHCLTCTFFTREASGEATPSSTGYCSLFTVRHFNGAERKACSKYTVRMPAQESRIG